MKNLLIIPFLVLILLSCKKEPKQGQITLNFEHIVAEKPFELNTENYVSPTSHPYQITKLQYYVSNVTFIGDGGVEQIFATGHLIDASVENTNKVVFQDINPNKYNKVKFRFGFLKEDNQINFLENTSANQNMEWPTQLGPGAYHYMKFEGKYDSLSTGTIKSFIYHFGPTNGNDNSFEVVLNIDEFEIDDNLFNIYINTDLQEWFQNPTSYNFPEYKMVMMNQSFQEIYQANGQNVFSFKQLTQDAE